MVKFLLLDQSKTGKGFTMKPIQKALITEAQSNIIKDPVYAKELLNEVLKTEASLVTETTWYHGDTRERTNFKDQNMERDPQESSKNSYGPGIYFSNSYKISSEYGPYVYEGKVKPSFKLLPDKNATIDFVQNLYAKASDYDKERFSKDWEIEDSEDLQEVLIKYSRNKSFNDAAGMLYNDLFVNNTEEYISALISLGYDGVIEKVESTRVSGNLYFLIVWNLQEIQIELSDYYPEEEY